MKLQCAKGTGVLFQNEQVFLEDVKCAKYKSPRWGGKVRKIKFPQYIINENFEKNENKFYVFILEFGYFI